MLDIQHPIIQAPMAGASGSAMVAAVSEAGGLGSLPCAMLDRLELRAEMEVIRELTAKPVNVNFFTHRSAQQDPERETVWQTRLAEYYTEFGLDPAASTSAAGRAPFDKTMCEVVEDLKPRVVSFHFGLPSDPLLQRVKNVDCFVMSSATTVMEARWLEDHGCDAIIAQGYEAGGHRGMFLTNDLKSQVGTMALVPQIVDSVNVPVIAAGGIADGRGIAAAMALGAAAVQIGTAYLFTPESLISDLHRAALSEAPDRLTVLTNVFSGRPARSFLNRIISEVGPTTDLAPQFPNAGHALAPLKARAEEQGSSDFSALWSGQAAGLGRDISARELTRDLADQAKRQLEALTSSS